MASSFVPLGEQREEQDEIEAVPTRDRVIALINQAQVEAKGNKLSCLNQVKELIINKDPGLLDSFLDEVIAFQSEGSPEVRKFVVTFMEEACKCDMGLLVRVVPIVAYMMEDSSTIVAKRILSCVIQLYRLAILHIMKLKAVDSDVKDMWETMCDVKTKVLEKIDSDNDGVRTIVLKFMEIVIISQTKKEPNSEPPKATDIDLSLDMIPMNHTLLDASDLREEAGTVMGSLLEMTVSPVITSVNLMTCIISLATIAKQRPYYVAIVVQAFELLHGNLPQHFTTSQISSVRKQLKFQILSVLRQPSSFECREQIVTLLTDLGCTQSEVAKNTPKMSQSAKVKKPRMEADPGSKSMEMSSGVKGTGSSGKSSMSSRTSGDRGTGEEKLPLPGASYMEAIDLTTSDLKPLLTPEVVTELVIATMRHVPAMPPSTFGSSYTPIAAAGTESQVKHLARLLASQMTNAGIGVGAVAKGIKPQKDGEPMEASPVVSDPRKRKREQKSTPEEEDSRKQKRIKQEPMSAEGQGADNKTSGPPPNLEQSMAELSYLGSLLGLPNIMDPVFPLAYATFFKSRPGAEAAITTSNLVSVPTTPDEEDKKEKEKRKFQATLPQKLKKIRKFDIGTFAKPLEPSFLEKLKLLAFKRILESENNFVIRGGSESQTRIKLIVNLVTLFTDFNQPLLEYIVEDLRGRFDLAMAWLYSKYSNQDASKSSSSVHTKEGKEIYNSCLVCLLEGARKKLPSKDRLFTKLVLEAPLVTFDALNIIVSYCNDEERAFLGISTLKELILRRPQGPGIQEDSFLNALLDMTVSHIELARIQAMHIAKKFYSKPDLALRIEKFALQKLQLLLHDHPVFEAQSGDMGVTAEWTESSVKLCFGLFVALLPINPKLLRDLAFIYTSTTSTVKRIILRQLHQPIRSIGMNSPDLLGLVENCPPGAETLIMRMLHNVTEGTTPSPELVSKVRELYRRNSSDARFLIPVIHGLTKQEVVAALPMFIQLTPTLVKGVLDRLLVSHGTGEHSHPMSPITPSELLIALHNIHFSSDEALMKCVIKASNLCMQEKSVFTQEVLAVVIQQLLEQVPIPVLFMKIVIQSLKAYPKLLSFVMTVLSKLITKQVWKQSMLWQGFIKCSEMTKPHSLPVLLQLPPQQMDNLLKINPEMSITLRGHIQTLPPHLLANIQRSMVQVLERYSEGPAGGMIREKSAKKIKKRRQSSKSERSEKEQSMEEEADGGTPAPLDNL